LASQQTTTIPSRKQPRRKTCEQLGVCAKTIKRWEKNVRLNFPTATVINGRDYDDPDQIADWTRSTKLSP
jgi:hypothetical protein